MARENLVEVLVPKQIGDYASAVASFENAVSRGAESPHIKACLQMATLHDALAEHDLDSGELAMKCLDDLVRSNLGRIKDAEPLGCSKHEMLLFRGMFRSLMTLQMTY